MYSYNIYLGIVCSYVCVCVYVPFQYEMGKLAGMAVADGILGHLSTTATINTIGIAFTER